MNTKTLTLALVFTGALTLNAQDYEKMLLFGQELYDFSITEACPEGEESQTEDDGDPDPGQCEGGGYVIAGTSKEGEKENIRILRVSDNGSPVWSFELDEEYSSRSFHVETFDAGYVLVGTNENFNHEIPFMIIDFNGNMVLNESIGFTEGLHFAGLHVTPYYHYELQETCFLITGIAAEALEPEPAKKILAVTVDQSGNVLWAHTYNTTEEGGIIDADMGAFGIEVPDIGFYITGSANVQQDHGLTNQGTLSLMIDYNGNTQWENSFAIRVSEENHYDFGAGAAINRDGNLVVLSNSSAIQGFYVTEVSVANGSVLGQRTFLSEYPHLSAFSIDISNNGQFMVSGLMANAEVAVNCRESEQTVPFIIRIENDLQNYSSAFYYPMPASEYHKAGGDFFGPFGGTSGTLRTLIFTPEMMHFNPETERATFLGYREDGPVGYRDLQFISTTPGGYAWCVSEDAGFEPNENELVFNNDIVQTPMELEIAEGRELVDAEIPTLDCSTSGLNGPLGTFPVVVESQDSNSVTWPSSNKSLSIVDGYTYMAGDYTGHVDFGGQSLNNSGNHLFLAKYDLDGSLLWLINGATSSSTGPRLSYFRSLAVDKDQSVYIAGRLLGTLQFTGAPAMYSASGAAFVAKFDASGNFLWQEQYENLSYFIIAVDNDDDLYASTNASGSVYLPSSSTPYNLGASSVALTVKLDVTNGMDIWRNYNAALTNHAVADMAVADDGTIFIGGDYIQGNKTPPYLAKISSSGTLQTVLDFPAQPGSDYFISYVAALDVHNSKVYASGYTEYGLSTGTCSISGFGDGNWLASFNTSNLNCVDMNVIAGGGLLEASTSDILAFSEDEVYAYGSAINTWPYSSINVDFGNGVMASTVNGTMYSIYLAQYDSNLDANWATFYGGSATLGRGYCIADDNKSCGVFITGNYGNQSWGSGGLDITSPPLPAPLGADAFIARIDNSGTAYKTANNSQKSTEGHAPHITETLKQEKSELWALYPNPAHGKFIIEMQGPGRHQNLIISDTRGREVLKRRLENGKNTIDAENLKSGFYIYTVSEENRVVKTGKLIIR